MPTRSVLNPFDWVKAYIISTSSGIDLPLPTVPESVSDQLSLNANEQQIVGRSSPIVSYISTGSRQLSFTIALADDYMPTDVNGNQYSITTYIAALKSLVYPNYTSDRIISPDVVCNIGNIKIVGIVTNVSVNWKGPLSSALFGGCFSRADVQITIKEVRSAVVGSVYIKNGGSDK